MATAASEAASSVTTAVSAEQCAPVDAASSSDSSELSVRVFRERDDLAPVRCFKVGTEAQAISAVVGGVALGLRHAPAGPIHAWVGANRMSAGDYVVLHPLAKKPAQPSQQRVSARRSCSGAVSPAAEERAPVDAASSSDSSELSVRVFRERDDPEPARCFKAGTEVQAISAVVGGVALGLKHAPAGPIDEWVGANRMSAGDYIVLHPLAKRPAQPAQQAASARRSRSGAASAPATEAASKAASSGLASQTEQRAPVDAASSSDSSELSVRVFRERDDPEPARCFKAGTEVQAISAVVGGVALVLRHAPVGSDGIDVWVATNRMSAGDYVVLHPLVKKPAQPSQQRVSTRRSRSSSAARSFKASWAHLNKEDRAFMEQLCDRMRQKQGLPPLHHGSGESAPMPSIAEGECKEEDAHESQGGE